MNDQERADLRMAYEDFIRFGGTDRARAFVPALFEEIRRLTDENVRKDKNIAKLHQQTAKLRKDLRRNHRKPVKAEEPTPYGVGLIRAERIRVLAEDGEGYTLEKDQGYTNQELISAAQAYLVVGKTRGFLNPQNRAIISGWPWAHESFKPADDDPVKNLIRAGQFIAAEIDRLGGLDGGMVI